jgi:hypothetical protein
MKLWPEIRDGGWLEDLLGNKISVLYWRYKFENAYNGKINTWDYQWTFSCWIQSALTVIPNVNLISNIGFGMKAEHTKVKNKFAEIETEPMSDPISHPKYVLRDSKADFLVENEMFSGISLIMRVIHRAISNLKSTQ